MASPISFDNTEVAFAYKSDRELRKAYWLFRLISNPLLVKTGKILVSIALKLHIPIGWAIRWNIFRQFCGGENIKQCSETSRILNVSHIGTILDYSVEGKEAETDLDKTCDEILATIRTAHNRPDLPFCVFKTTGISRFDLLEKKSAGTTLNSAENSEWERVIARVDSICKLSHDTGTPVFIDAEDSWVQQAIDDLAESMMVKYNKEKAIVFNTIQLYRHDRLQYMKDATGRGRKNGYYLGYKLVRGAYMEKERVRAVEKGYPDPIQPNKPSTDRDFDLALAYCIQNIDRVSICAGTHNEQSSLELTRLMAASNVAPGDQRIYFAQLFGMSDHISFNLAHAGYNVAKYVPYGPIREVLPYLIRRAEENTSVKGQTSRELSLIQKELRRRKSK